jgi:hypothetical protein
LQARAIGSGEHAVSVAADPTFALPLLATGLAQRFPGARQRSLAAGADQREDSAREEEAALA